MVNKIDSANRGVSRLYGSGMGHYSTSVAPVVLSVVAIVFAVVLSLSKPLSLSRAAVVPTNMNVRPPTHSDVTAISPKQRVVHATLNASMAEDMAAAAVLRSLEAELRQLKTPPAPVVRAKPRPPVAVAPTVATANPVYNAVPVPLPRTPEVPLSAGKSSNVSFLSRLAGADDIVVQNRKGRGFTLQMRPNSRILAPEKAVVAYVGNFRSYGQVMILRFSQSQKKYLLLSGQHTPQVSQGTTVQAGDVIGVISDHVTPELYAEWRAATG